MKTPLTFAADSNTDIWKKPPTHDVFTAPYRPHSKGPALNFLSASISFRATYTQQFDQAGILLAFTRRGDRKWIKSGVEYFDKTPRLSTVCTDNYSDWSVADVPSGDLVRTGQKSVTILIERSDDGNGFGMWVYHLDGENKTPLREITWPYGTAGEGWELEVSAAIARPSKDTQDQLEATFDSVDVKWQS
ncbi:hypothetical protein AAL_02440 [Moelleriella libera RCEF 2490]|uniref:DUF1349 domain-containing protein n=1 Tax=Moelleriella libera RCEF 2490 TaxID=1081109 RepID=A0A168EKB0_9HYPO|nr:hypothetical protein AAL_02440 [Moelleriella libera RCEF 2490]